MKAFVRRATLAGVAAVTAGGALTAPASAAPLFPSRPVTVTVCARGCTYQSISNAVAAAVSGEVIKVGPGSYAGGFVVRTAVTIEGAGPWATIIRGSGPGSVVEVEAAPVTIMGVTVTGGTAGSAGGGGLLVGSGLLNLRDCRVTGNQAPSAGAGGGGINTDATLNVTSCEIDHNTTTGGQAGGMHVGASGVVTVTGGLVNANSARWGGGLDIDAGGSVALSRTDVSQNEADLQGGGIDNNGSLAAQLSAIALNRAGTQGGGLIQNGAATLDWTAVMGNRDAAGLGNGGGVYVTAGHTLAASSSPIAYNSPDNLVIAKG